MTSQRAFFDSGQTRPLAFRLEQLSKLGQALKDFESQIFVALKSDLGKSSFESYSAEVGFLHQEIADTRKSLSQWMKPKSVATPWVLKPGSSAVYAEPRGQVLIIGPWNYPIQLILAPLIGAIAAGNCTVLKLSELAPASSEVLSRLVLKTFSRDFVQAVEGGPEASAELLKQPFDYIFFTGSTSVGRIVMRAAAENLTPVTLELGGKSPCIVDSDVDLKVAVRRIVWGKFMNAGQTCVAPDYLLVHKSLKEVFIEEFRSCLKDFFGDDASQSPDYARVVNPAHFDRLHAMLHEGTVLIGGQANREHKYIAPTLVGDLSSKSKAMEGEIFGPILPLFFFAQRSEALAFVKAQAKPLALYVFSNDSACQKYFLEQLSFGGGCVNDTLLHWANPHLPCGGVGPSGLGAYHGKASFETFSHFKSVLKKSFSFDLKLRYPPYEGKLKWMRKIFRA